MKKRKTKILFLSTIWIGIASILASSSLLLVSCSAANEEEEVKRISKGDGNNFAISENTTNPISSTLKSVAYDSLFNEVSMKKVLEGKISNTFYKAIETISKTNATFARDLGNKNEEIDENLKQSKEQAKDASSSNWKENFQDNTLDPNGGTEESWKENEKNTWALTYLTDKIFEKSFVFVEDNTTGSEKILETPQLSDLMKALNKESNYSFVWKGENELENMYANIQNLVFNSWLENERPMIINMSLWKYGVPKGGINAIYNTNIGGNETASTKDSTLAGTYEFPYFSNTSDNETFNTIEKFNNFINDSMTKENYKLPQIGGVNNTAGLIDIPFNYTEDSSTYMLAKTSSIYNNLYAEFAMGSLALFYDTWSDPASKYITVSNTKEIDETTNVLDSITKQFISPTTFSTTQTTIPSNMVDKMVNTFGDLSTLRNNPLFSIDAFKIKNKTSSLTYKLSDFMLLRNEAGVHAIAIDGYDHIKTATTPEEAITKYGDVILYRSILENKGLTNLQGNTALSINLETELKTYFNENKEKLITDFLKSSDPNVNLYFPNNYWSDIDSLTPIDSAAGKFYSSLAEYIFNIKNNNLRINLQDKFRDTKIDYSNNFGEKSIDNGFASPWIYTQNISDGLFNLINIYGNVLVYGPAAADGTKSLREKYIETIQPYLTSLLVEKLVSANETFPFSQLIYSNNFYLNLSIKEYMTTQQDDFANKLKSEVFSKNVEPYFNVSTNNFNDQVIASIPDLNILNKQLSNTYYSSLGFDNITGNKFIDWYKFNSNSLPTDTPITPNQIIDYKTNLYNESLKINLSNIYTKKFDLYLLASTVKYLLEDKDGDGVIEFLNHLQNKIIFGKDFYFVWSDALNGKLESANKNITTNNLLNINRLKINNNNDYSSKYFTNQGLLPTDATGNNIYSDGTYGVGSKHYNVMDSSSTATSAEKIGYYGLQSSSNSLPSIVSDKLFNSPREGSTIDITSKGLLYQYGSKDKLLSYIDSIKFISDLETLASDISKELSGGFDIDKIFKAVSIDDKKDAFKTEINLVNIEAFNKFDGVISEIIIPDTTTSNYYGAYAKQINYSDVTFSPTNSTTPITFNEFVTAQGSNVVYNLLIQTAMDQEYQDIVLNEISLKNKFEVFDLNAKAALGNRWVVDEEEETNK